MLPHLHHMCLPPVDAYLVLCGLSPHCATVIFPTYISDNHASYKSYIITLKATDFHQILEFHYKKQNCKTLLVATIINA